MACFLANGGLELILGSVTLIYITVKAAIDDRRPKGLSRIK